MAIYRDARTETDPVNGAKWQVIDQDYLDRIHDDSRKFVDAALANSGLRRGKLAGLLPHADALHLRPGVRSAAPGRRRSGGAGDLTCAALPLCEPESARAAHRHLWIRRSGQPGDPGRRQPGDQRQHQRRLRAAFPSRPTTRAGCCCPACSHIAATWWCPISAVAGARHDFPVGALLNFELPLSQTRFAAGTAAGGGHLAQPLTLPAGTILAAAVHDANGALLYPAARCWRRASRCRPTRLGAGSVLAATATLAPLRWPAGAAARVDGRRQAVPAGVGRQAEPAARAHLPSGTDVKLPDGASMVELRADKAGTQGRNWALAAMLPAGSQSWGLRLVGGADLGPRIHAPSASTRAPAMWCWPTRTMPRASWTTSRS